MLDSALLQTNFVGRDGFVWWIGQVAPPDVWRDKSTDLEEGWAFRCKVRIIGFHSFSKNILPDEDLPWAHVLVDASKGAGQGMLGESSSMVGGETVFGFFLDGEEAQQPVIFGALARNVNKDFGPANFEKPPESYGNYQGSTIQEGESIATSEENAFGVVTGKIFDYQPTTEFIAEEKPVATPEENAENKAGEIEEEKQQEEDGSGETEGGFKEDAATNNFNNTQLGPHTRDDGCGKDPIADIATKLGSFLTTVNSLTEFAGVYIDAANNLIGDIKRIVNKFTRLISAAIKKIMNKIRDKITKLLSGIFRKLQALIVPEPQKPMVSKALQKIIDIIFCLFDTSFEDLFDMLKDMLLNMVGKAINPTVCAIEQAIANLLGGIYDSLTRLLGPILDGLDWLMGALGSIGGLLGKISSYINMILSFLNCTGLACKEYEDWTQGMGLNTKPATKMSSVLDNMEVLKGLEQFADSASFSGDNEDGTGVYDARARFSILSMMGGGIPEFFDCNNKTQSPKTQDDLGHGIPPGFFWSECIPPKVEVHGDGTKTAALVPIVSSEDGSILTLEITEPGRNYTEPPTITIVDKTRKGGGAKAEAIIDDEGKVVDVYMLSAGSGYCIATNVIPTKYPVTEGPTPIEGSEDVPPYITFTTPADDAVGVQTSASLSITFNEPIVKGVGEVVITESVSNVVHERINIKNNRISFLSDRIIKVDPKNDLKFNTEYYISMSEGSFKDLADNSFAGLARTDTYNFTTRGISGIGSEAVGIVTSLIPYRPGIGYTSGDSGQVGACTFDLVVTPAGSIVGINNINCQDKHKSIPEVTLNTRTGRGAQLIPIISYSPNFVADSGARPSIDGGFGGGGIPIPDGAKAGGNLFVKVVDCVYSLPKKQIGWVNGNPYFGPFHFHPATGRKMVGAFHVNTPHDTIYNTKEESLGQPVRSNYVPPSEPANNQSPQTTETTNVPDTTTTSQPDTSVADTTPTINNTPQQTTQPTTPQQQTPPPTPPSTPPPSPPPAGGGGSGGSGGGGYGGGY